MLNELHLRVPVSEIGQIAMHDEHSLKFITVFNGKFSSAPNFDTNQIDSLVYMPSNELHHRINYHPEIFTETFISICNAINIFK